MVLKPDKCYYQGVIMINVILINVITLGFEDQNFDFHNEMQLLKIQLKKRYLELPWK